MKTLGVKFKVAGVEEAQTALNSLRARLNQSLKQNKQAVNDSVKLSARLSRFRFRRPIVQDRVAVNSGTTSPVQSDREPVNNIVRLDNRSIEELAERISLSATTGDDSLPDPLKQIKKRGLVGGSFANLGFSFRSIYKGFLESIGAGLGTDFGEGLKKALEDDLDFSFRRRGEVTGKSLAFTVSEGGRGFWDNFKNLIEASKNAKLKRTNPDRAKDDVDSVSRALVKLVTLLPSKMATGYRRAAVQLEGLPRVEKLKKRPENEGQTYTDTTDEVIYTINGFGGQQGVGGYKIAEQLSQYVDESTEVVGLENRFTDLSVNFKKTTQWVIEALGTIASINVKGFNPDAIQGAAKIINDLDANPNLKATILGHSAGGFVSEEITQILNLLGYGDRIRGIAAGTPNLKGRIEPENFTRVMGDRDDRMRKFENAVNPVGFVENDANILEGVEDHFFEDYLASEDFLNVVLGDRTAKLIKEYQKYLENLAKQYSRVANTQINDLLPGYQNFSTDDKKSGAQYLNQYVKENAKRYRQAIRDNNLNLAKEIGEDLIRQIQFLRKIYADILDEGGDDRSIQGKVGNLKVIEKEIISGQPNMEAQGYDPKGLVNHFGDRLTGEASFVVDGFVDGIKAELNRVREAGEDIGENLQEGTDDNLGIQSPATVFIKKGKQAIAGLVKGVQKKLKDAVEAGRNIGEATIEGVAESDINNKFQQIGNQIEEFFNAIGDRFPILKKFKGILTGIAALFVAKLGLDAVISIFKKISSESLEAAMAMESLNLSIIFASRNALKGAAALEFISQSARRLSVDLIGAKNQYSKLLAAARNTSLEGGQINRVFTAFAQTASNRGLSAAQQGQVFKALEQIINKRYLGREEVVQQLGDVFSGFEGATVRIVRGVYSSVREDDGKSRTGFRCFT